MKRKLRLVKRNYFLKVGIKSWEVVGCYSKDSLLDIYYTNRNSISLNTYTDNLLRTYISGTFLLKLLSKIQCKRVANVFRQHDCN